jgi:hypothetical protein
MTKRLNAFICHRLNGNLLLSLLRLQMYFFAPNFRALSGLLYLRTEASILIIPCFEPRFVAKHPLPNPIATQTLAQKPVFPPHSTAQITLIINDL